MNNEIKELLIKMNKRMDHQEKMMEQLIDVVGKSAIKQEEMDKKLDRIEASVNRLEENEPANIMSMLKQLNRKLDDRDYELQALNKRVFKTETEIERLTRQ